MYIIFICIVMCVYASLHMLTGFLCLFYCIYPLPILALRMLLFSFWFECVTDVIEIVNYSFLGIEYNLPFCHLYLLCLFVVSFEKFSNSVFFFLKDRLP